MKSNPEVPCKTLFLCTSLAVEWSGRVPHSFAFCANEWVEIAAFGGVLQRPTAITTARDKVQVVRSVVGVQAFGHCGTGLSARRRLLAVTELQSRLWESPSFAQYANEWGTRLPDPLAYW